MRIGEGAHRRIAATAHGRTMASSLVCLPGELQRELALRLDGPSLARVGATCRSLHLLSCDDALWRALTIARFRVSPSVMQSRRLKAAGGASWRALYSQWATAQRMPSSRVSGPGFPVLARGRVGGALAWVTVHSADDCLLRQGAVRLRVVVQNVRPGRVPLQVVPRKLAVTLANGFFVGSHSSTRDGYAATIAHCSVFEAEDAVVEVPVTGESPPVRLRKDEFAVIRLSVKVPDGRYEVDALERLAALDVPVQWGDEELVRLHADFRDKPLWEMYERLPGGSWVRRQAR